MPGLGSVNGVAIVLPLTFIVPPSSAIVSARCHLLWCDVWGAVSSILLGIPGASTAVATTFDGRPMAQKGQAGLALIAAAVAFFVGGTISVILFTLFAAPLADIALSFGPAEEFVVLLLHICRTWGDDSLKTIIMICLGLALSTVGLDLISGTAFDLWRYAWILFWDFLLVLAIGTYGLGEILYTIETSKLRLQLQMHVTFAELARVKAHERLWKTMSLGSFLGFSWYAARGGGNPAALMSYGIAKQTSKTSDTFGKGNIEGVAAPETANNAASTGSLPMLTQHFRIARNGALTGRHGDVVGAGPMLFIEQPDFVWGLISSLYTANFAAVAVNIALIPVFVWALRVPFTVLCALVVVLCIVGGFAPSQKIHDVWLIFAFGVGGYLLREPLSLGPLVLAHSWAIDGKASVTLIAEQGNILAFVERPLSAPLSVWHFYSLSCPSRWPLSRARKSACMFPANVQKLTRLNGSVK